MTKKNLPKCTECDKCVFQKSQKHDGWTHYCSITKEDIGASYFGKSSPKNCPKRNGGNYMANYTVEPCVSDYVVCRDGKGIPELIVNSHKNALLIAAILQKDQKCDQGSFEYGFTQEDFDEVTGTKTSHIWNISKGRQVNVVMHGIDADVNISYNPLAERHWYKVQNVKCKNGQLFRELQVGDVVRHFKGNLYIIVSCGVLNSETEQYEVIYRALYPDAFGNYQTFAKPYSMFMEKVDKTKYPDAEQEYRMEIVTFDNVRTDTDYLNSIPGMAESIQEGKKTPIEDCVPEENVDWGGKS